MGRALIPARGWLETTYASPMVQALWSPWVLHTGLTPESTYSGQMGKVIAFALEAAGAPVVKGGSGQAVAAFKALIEERGGVVRTGVDVDRIIVEGGKACGVQTSEGERIEASHISASVAPGQLYERLLRDEDLPVEKAATGSFRHGRGDFQLHYALDRAPEWLTPGLDQVALIHLADGIDSVSKSANEAERGMLPETPTICVGQPHRLDATRCPDGKAILWLQIPARHIKDFDKLVLKRRAYSPADLAAMNVNLVGGDPYGGACSIDQFFIWRPFAHSVNGGTAVRNLHHIGASTHPGPGLGGGSGYLLAKRMGA
jgi:phytoene dehydrogenase-like protein